MKKLLTLAFALTLMVCLIAFGSTAASAATSGDYEYTVTNGEATITKYNGAGGDVIIPDTLGGYPVTTIGDCAFASCKSLTSVIIPDSVTTIGDDAFWNCESLTSVTIGKSVTTIGDYAFYYCESLTSVTIGDGVTTIGNLAFYWCDSLTSVVIGNNVTTIGNKAFYNCNSLTAITIPNSVATIGYEAFYDCVSLTSVTIGKSVTTIGSSAFSECTSLTDVYFSGSRADKQSISIDDDNSNLTTATWHYADPNDNDYDYTISNGEATITGYFGSGGNVTIPSTLGGYSVTAIDEYVFLTCPVLTSVTIPDSVTTIGEGAFSRCPALTAIDVSTGNPAYASEDGVLFNKDMTMLIQYPGGKTGAYTIPDSVTTIGNSAFSGCNSLTSVTIGNNVTSISDYAFEVCDSLASVTISNSVTTIGRYAFYACNSLKSVSIPNSVIIIDYGAFMGCLSLTDVYYSGDKTDRAIISIDSENYNLLTATWHYSQPVAITTQPKNVSVENGATAKVTVSAAGNGLTYQWYYKNAGASKFSLTTSFTGNSYSVKMDSTRNGRQVYCVITDQYGSSVTTDTVTLTMKTELKITKQPVSICVANGEKATVKVTAMGEGLTYKWYFKDAGASKYTYTSSFKGNSYSIIMTDARAGRRVLCIVYDKYGNSVQSKSVLLSQAVRITKQPTNVCVVNGKTVTIKVTAKGDGLTYKWYYKDAGASSYKLTTTFKGNTYTTTMTDARAGRRVLCKVYDKYGNMVKSDSVVMVQPVRITKQPVNVTVAKGATAKVTVSAKGEGLTYSWFYMNKGGSEFIYTASFTGNSYSVKMDSSRNGRQVCCIITDKFGNSVQSNIVTLKMK